MRKAAHQDRVRIGGSARSRATLEQARATGLVGKKKDARVASRISSKLLSAAKKRAGTDSDTEVVEIALATLALEDDFGRKLLRLKGSVPRDVKLEF